MKRQRGRGKQTGLPRDNTAMTFAEIGKELGITPGGAWMAYQRGMRKLRRKLKRNEFALIDKENPRGAPLIPEPSK